MMTEIDVDKMDLDDAYDWLDNKDIEHNLESLDEMKELIRITIQGQSKEFQEQISEKVEKALLLEISMKQDISDIYTSFIDVIDMLPSEVTMAGFGRGCECKHKSHIYEVIEEQGVSVNMCTLLDT
ncbi:hypothetical protein DPMN_041496 [Dreissena polymorpha]|uniref:Uncharacterized protein n=1 Tax=Dreissena polymorpha TaxID=45954 RepID=A0A9D4CZF5_DREPO|nr:hypothetical protein DPMN_041496 [Dreissena polymorpha]